MSRPAGCPISNCSPPGWIAPARAARTLAWCRRRASTCCMPKASADACAGAANRHRSAPNHTPRPRPRSPHRHDAMPNRVIRDDLLDSDRIRSLPTDSHRMLFVELLLLADDYGTAPANPALLERRAPSCHGKKHDVIAGLLDALAEQGLVVVYEVARNRYVFIPRFRNWPRGRKPRHPLPPEPFASQINELVKKRNADALQMHSTCSAHARETETETEKKDPSN